MANVYFIPVPHEPGAEKLSQIGRKLLEILVEKENLSLEKEIPLKLHFGERGNFTFLKPETYDGIIDFLEEKEIKSAFTETSVLYGGERFNSEKHTLPFHTDSNACRWSSQTAQKEKRRYKFL